MSEQHEQNSDQNAQDIEAQDSKADNRAVLVIFTAAIILAIHVVSGFTFDF